MMSGTDVQGVEDFDYAELCEKIEGFAADFDGLPRLNLAEMKPSPDSRSRLKALHEAANLLFERAEAELPPGWDLKPVVLARNAIMGVRSVSMGGYYSPFRGRSDASPESIRAYADARKTMKEAVRLAQRLRDCGPDVPRIHRLVEAVGRRRALKQLANDLEDLLTLLEDSALADDARAELRTAANLVSRNAANVPR